MTRASMVALLALALLVAPLAVEAQPGKVYRIGFINASNPAPNPLGPNPEQRPFDAFVQRMRELGYVVGQNLVIETRSAEAKFVSFRQACVGSW